MHKKKLRVGLLLDDYKLPHWAYKMIEIIMASNHSEIKLVVRSKGQAAIEKTSLAKRIWNNRKYILFLLYSKWEYKQFQSNPNAFAIKDAAAILSCPEIVVTPKSTNYSVSVLSEDIEEIKKNDIDVFIGLGFKALCSEIISSAKYGVWTFHHGDGKVLRGTAEGVWEVFENWDVTGVNLNILTDDPVKRITLYESFSATDQISVLRNKNNYYWKSLSLIPRKLNELFNLGDKEFFENAMEKNTIPHFYYNKLYTTPNNLQVIKGVCSNYWKAIKRKINRIFYFEQWVLLYKLEREEKISSSFYRFNKLLPPKDRIWADPFLLYRNNRYYIFIEEMLFKENKGKIAVIEMDKNGNYSKPQIVLERDYHLSYPFLFEENDILYMIPETQENGTIELYKCNQFPLKWELDRVLISGIQAVDATIFKYKNTYWLFANVLENPGASLRDELFLYYSDNLFGEWKSHPKNPIVSDVRCSRPAGNIFVYNGKIYRPSQNSTKHYGRGMHIMEITELSENAYSENLVQPIFPNWSKEVIGTHTLNYTGNLTIIDALVKRTVWN